MIKCGLEKSLFNVGRPKMLPATELFYRYKKKLAFYFNTMNNGTIYDSIEDEEIKVIDYKIASYDGTGKGYTTSVLNIGSPTKLDLEFSLKFDDQLGQIVPLIPIDYNGTTANSFMILIYDDGTVGMSFYDDTATLNSILINVACDDNAWHDYKFSIDTIQPLEENLVKAYLDGSEVTGLDVIRNIGINRSWVFADNILTIGCHNTEVSYYTGEIYNLKIYNSSNQYCYYPDVYTGIDVWGNDYHIRQEGVDFELLEDFHYKLNYGYTNYNIAI